MKRLILVLCSSLLLSTAAFGERFLVQDFINSGISSIQVSNTIPVTNIASAFSYSTNTVGIIYTNALTQITTAAGDSTSFFHDVLTHVVAGVGSRNTNTLSDTRIVVTIASGAVGSAESCILTFSQVPDGENELTTAAERWGFGVVGVNSSTTTVYTNLPGWVAASPKLRLVGITSTSTNAAIKVKAIKLVDVAP